MINLRSSNIPTGRIYHKPNGSNSDIRKVLESPTVMKIAMSQTAQLAQKFKGKTTKETCYNIWKFLKNNIQYREDGMKAQNIKLPSRFLKDGSGDCKSYSLFTAAILNNLGIRPYWTYASYNQDSTPQHVYITTKDGCIVDGVWNSFNSEKKPNFKSKKIASNGG